MGYPTRARILTYSRLDDLTVRFLLNLPASELSSVPRLCFQVEEAQWYYEDFIRPAAAAAGHPLPSLPLRQFCLQLFQHCPLLSGFTDAQHIAAYEEFLAYKVRVPVRGAILMDETMEKLVLVKGWKKGASWSFPRGKINKDEKDLDCAIREVYEETGYDIRQAGLVPENEEHGAKYIDVTMREQHMRLFVFKGVPEDTYFEPQTRKEISKIAWYNVRDLPGFKKNKQGADATNYANKFYMVAPFLGHLKKWISQQRRLEPHHDVQLMAPEADNLHAEMVNLEAETDGQLPETAAVDKAKELKRLLSIGAPTVASASQQAPTLGNGQSNDLLALLRGGPKAASSIPHTPFEQIRTVPPEPETPHPHHPRHASMGYQQPVPQFPPGPQRLQQQLQPQQRNFSVPIPGPFGPGPNGFQPSQQQGFPQIPPPGMHPQQFHQQMQSMHGGGPPRMEGFAGPHNGAPFHLLQRQPMQPPLNVAAQQQQHFPRPSDTVMAQGPGAIEAGPGVPKAENLPMPNLNPHTMNLLNAFKSGNKPTPSGSSASNAQPRQGSQHQAALLNLFRKPSAVPTPASAAAAGAGGANPSTLPEVVQRPGRAQERRPTLNEITRTLPARLKVKSPPPLQELFQDLPMQAAIPSETQPERPSSRQLYDPAQPKPFVRASSEALMPAQGALDPQVRILKRQSSHQTPRLANPARSPKPKHASPARPSVAPKGAENGTPTPPAFTILARPGSSARGSKSPALPRQQHHHAPSGPSTSEASQPSFQPQVLKRPESVDPSMVQKAAEVVEKRGSDAGDKREQLLSLFGKAPTPAPAPAPAPAGTDASKSNLLDLFTGPPKSTATVPAQVGSRTVVSPDTDTRKHSLLSLLSSPPQAAAATPSPPAAPHIQPERQPSSQTIAHRGQQPAQNALLDLFTRPSSAALNSPGTPISPFTLGTPVTKVAPGLGQEHSVPRSRLNSVATAEDGSRRSSGAGTPTEASRGFLLDYLHGVVQKEGHRGAKRS